MYKVLSISIIIFINLIRIGNAKPLYSYEVLSLKMDTVENKIYVKFTFKIINNSKWRCQTIPCPIITPHLQVEAYDSFAYTGFTSYENFAFYIFDSLGNKCYLHPASNNCSIDWPHLITRSPAAKFIKLKAKDSRILSEEQFIGFVVKNSDQEFSCVGNGGFRKKGTINNQSNISFIDISNGKFQVYYEYKIRKRIYQSTGSVVLQ